MHGSLDAVMRGAMAGAVATLPMSVVMEAARRAGLMGEHPPEVIAEAALDAAGVPHDEEIDDLTATAAHIGFGATAGALFGLVRRAELPVPPVLQGVAWGLLVYTVSYSGWIPALHILPPPEHDRPGRQPSMVAAHVVYGAVLGALAGAGSSKTGERAERDRGAAHAVAKSRKLRYSSHFGAQEPAP